MSAALSLDEYLDAAEIEGIETLPADEENPERFKLTSTDAADWAFRKLAKLKAEKAANLDAARAQRDRIDAWVEQVNGPVDHSIEYFEGLLTEWAAVPVLEELAEVQDWKKVRHKTHSTPNGKVSARRSENGSFISSEEGRKHAVATLTELDRYDLLDLKVGATPLEKARDEGTVKLNDRNEYEVLNKETGEWVPLPGVGREGVGRISFTVST